MKVPQLVLVSLLATSLLLPVLSKAQKSTLFGQVLDVETNVSIPGARIILENTGNGAIADWDGKYEVTGVKKGVYRLLIESEGYFTDTIEEFRIKEKFREENFSLKLIPCVPREDPVLKSANILCEKDTISPAEGQKGIEITILFQGRWGDQFKLFRTWGLGEKEVILNIFRTEKVDCEPQTPFPDPYYDVEFTESLILPEKGEYRLQLRSDDLGKELFLKRILVQTF